MLVNYRTGEVITPKQAKAYVMQARGWTTEQYNKEYDKLRNKARNYETATGKPRGEIRVNELLYSETKVWARQGKPRDASGEATPQLSLFRTVDAQTSAGTAQFARLTAKAQSGATLTAREAGTLERANERAKQAILKQYAPLRYGGKDFAATGKRRENYETGADIEKIIEESKTPQELSERLNAYAKALHESPRYKAAQRAKRGKQTEEDELFIDGAGSA